MTTHPEVLWAQRSSKSAPEKNVIYFTINLPDLDVPSLKYELTPTNITFSAKAGTEGNAKNYAFSIDFFAEVDPENSTKRVTDRSLFAVIRKKEAKEEFWPRLTKAKVKTAFIKTDFSKWVDEDEQDVEQKDDDYDPMGEMPGMGMPGMGGLGGGMDFEKMMASMGGAGGASMSNDNDANDDDDDDGPPPLEDAEPPKA